MSLTLKIDNKIACIVMDDGKVNALDNDWFRTLLNMLDEVEASDAIALIITGREKVFSGGLNIKWLPTMNKRDQVEFSQLFPKTMGRLYHFSKPTIAAISGHAMAGGCIIACACDRRLALRGFNLAMNEVLIEMVIPEWIIDIVSNAVPKPFVNDMLSYAEFLSTEKAYELGVVRELFDDTQEMMGHANTLAESYDKFSPSAFAGTKAKLRK
jgi:enoyl-CoA hydratase/carnithine racemase